MTTKRTKRRTKTGSSRKALGMLGVNFCFVKYSEVEDLRQKLNDASIALSQTAKSLADIKWMSMRPREKEESLQKSMGISDIKQHMLLHNRTSGPDAFEIDGEKALKYIGLPWADLISGQRRKSQKK